MTPTREEFLFLDGPLNKAVFYVLTFLSIGIMLYQIYGRARFWMKGKPITWKPAYVANVLTYIVGQRKVMGSRPKTGAPMHLLIFYGFLGLFLATTLLAISTYGPLIGIPHFHQGTYYLVYEATFDAVGLMFLAGIVWAAIRRYKYSSELGEPVPDPETGKQARSPNPLTTEWKDYAVLGLLFLLTVTGFLLEAGRISANPKPYDAYSFVGFGISKILPNLQPQGYRLIWWFHMIWVWSFFIFLPQMRLKHILVATLTAAGSPENPLGKLPNTPQNTPEIELPGAAFATDYSRWHLMSLDACMSCGRCTEVCPAYGVGKPLNPKQVIYDLHRALNLNEGVAASISEESLWACTTCNACVEACPVLIRHVDIIVDARRNLVSQGSLSGSGTVVLRQIGSTDNAWGQPSNTREDWMTGLDIPLCRNGEPFEYLFWVGCAGSTDPGAVKTTKAFAQLMKKAGVSFACLGREENCTGDPARRLGDEFTYQDQAAKNKSVFEKYSVKKLVTACPHCLNTLKNEYPEIGTSIEVVHHTQLLADLVQQGKLNAIRGEPGETAYHDPCYLARVNNISDAPRRMAGEQSDYDSDLPLLLNQPEPDEVTFFAEPQHRAKKTLCCGAGGGRMWMEEDPDQRPANRRSEELLATGAKQVAVSCPFCRIMLDASLKQVSDQEIRLLDLAEMLQEANQ